MKMLVLSDVHQRDFKWSKLASAVLKEKPDVVCIAGDLVVNTFLFKHEEFVEKTIKKYARMIKEVCPYLFVIPGNDDNGALSNYLLTTDGSDNLWYNIHDRVISVNGFEFAGVPYVLDHPFGYKYWCVRETDEDLKINPVQLCRPLTSDGDINEYVEIKDYHQFLYDRPSMKTILNAMSHKISNMSKAIFLIHCPPVGCGLDITSRGDICGSKSIIDFILDKQPLLTIHGHIHESPHYSGKWCCQINNTWAIQAGQIENDLYYVMVEIENDKVVNLRHSIYGEQKL